MDKEHQEGDTHQSPTRESTGLRMGRESWQRVISQGGKFQSFVNQAFTANQCLG